MGENSKIPWTDDTFNPWWGCTKVAKECENCYAEKHAKRFGTNWGAKSMRRFFSVKHWNEPLKWQRKAAKANDRRRVFCGSMCDVFEDRTDLVEHRERLWNLILETPDLDWLLLTKRPENIAKMVPWMQPGYRPPRTPWANVWIGVTAGTQERYEQSIEHLRQVPAIVRFVSIEPILEQMCLQLHDWAPDWVIVGDESGYHRRPADLEWVRHIRNECLESDVCFFFKQWHRASFMRGDRDLGKVIKVETPELDGRRWVQVPG